MFLLQILCVSLLCRTNNFIIGYENYLLDFNEDDEIDYYEDYYEETPTREYNESGNRVRRYESKSTTSTVLSPEEMRKVRGALNQILDGLGHENPFTPHSEIETTIFKIGNSETFNGSTATENSIEISTLNLPDVETQVTETKPTHTEFNLLTFPTKPYKTFEYRLTTEQHFKNTTDKLISKRTTYKPKRTQQNNKSITIEPLLESNLKSILRQRTTTPTTITTENNTETITDTIATKSRELDMPRLLSIIADLAGEFETNLTRKLNETLYNMSIPTCTTPTTEPPTTSEYDANYTGVTVAKCFVCGLDIHGVPRHAHCADAFAGDFLPLVPVDPTAKGRISTYRKYCKYANVRGYTFNSTHPRAIYGRWTGGCAVRWIDLSGIYTQRTCRSRLQPSLGRHYASKRMAKLERSLWNIENGCIVSPMATLVPLSRGVSLYARFHACVCTGNWCNFAIANKPWMLCHLMLLCVTIIRRKHYG